MKYRVMYEELWKPVELLPAVEGDPFVLELSDDFAARFVAAKREMEEVWKIVRKAEMYAEDDGA